MSASLAASPVNFHLSLNVSDLDRSVEFFRTVFGEEPAKCRSDYAKFEIQNPPITLALEPSTPEASGALNHAGFRLENSAQLIELQRRLEMAGLASEREEGVECCYSRQTKFWLHDPDGTLWEFYVLEDDIDHRGAGQSQEAVLGKQDYSSDPPSESVECDPTQEKRTWTHRLGQPFAVPNNLTGGDLDEVMLQGTFNSKLDDNSEEAILTECYRLLVHGGRLAIHCLTGDRKTKGEVNLPGPAAVVRHVPVDVELLEFIEECGFVEARLMKFASTPCFQADEVQMRETMIEAFKPGKLVDAERVTVVYKGPFRGVTLDQRYILRRGHRCELPASIWNSALEHISGEDFVVLANRESSLSCTG